MSAVATERPILFSGPMVRAILDGRKTQTRRVVKPQPHAGIRRDVFRGGIEDGHGRKIRLSYCVGDRLWVREAHAIVPVTAYAMSTDDGVHRIPQQRNPTDPDTAVVYREGWTRCKPGRWRPSIHMPRWASRITLEVTEVRVERVQDITNDDVAAEGAAGMCAIHPGVQHTACSGLRPGFRKLWDEINAKRGYGWDENPWVWVVGFRRVEAA